MAVLIPLWLLLTALVAWFLFTTFLVLWASNRTDNAWLRATKEAMAEVRPLFVTSLEYSRGAQAVLIMLRLQLAKRIKGVRFDENDSHIMRDFEMRKSVARDLMSGKGKIPHGA